MRHQGGDTHLQMGLIQKYHAPKLSCMILSTKSKRDTLERPSSTWLQLYMFLENRAWNRHALEVVIEQL